MDGGNQSNGDTGTKDKNGDGDGPIHEEGTTAQSTCKFFFLFLFHLVANNYHKIQEHHKP